MSDSPPKNAPKGLAPFKGPTVVRHKDAARFLAWTRANQQPTDVWYAAYPGLSIVNVNANTEIRHGLADPACLDASSWLFRLRGVDRLAADKQFSDQRQQLPLQMEDIQGIMLWGYGHMPQARYLLFRVVKTGPALLNWIARASAIATSCTQASL